MGHISRSLIYFFLGLIITTSVLLLNGCENPIFLRVTNQTDFNITINIDGVKVFTVPPHKVVNRDTKQILVIPEIFVEGITQSGKFVYSRFFDSHQSTPVRRGLDMRAVFDIVITPTETQPYLPLTIVNNTKYPVTVSVEGVPIYYLSPGATITKRPLPSDQNEYNINASAPMTSTTDKATSYWSESIFHKTITRDELQQLNWQVVITPNPSSP